MSSPEPATILFDGVCNLCNGFVQFIIRHDPAGRFRFASLQSAAGRAVLEAQGAQLPAADPESVLLVADGQVYSHSTAVLQIARRLGGMWRLLTVARLLPRRWRDALYRFVARHRYQWFGRQDACLLPSPELAQRFL
ncbi:thiol-disulfide oxidoreductase DCC family protein [Hymenobacter persicinus]|uniref:Thiol-disulfide oxidoreductase DCC family protein n=1 Tax=Hymenobacter persicinus TaxID=2025506 RepID=A0A4Q5L9N1_9BACT|nr:thiol-disulfide oxidoreductase DCC family protein [Hymenobacter persicinus]RYU77136.1 thiol-disulfide oxidoreductase DCC family protein [Hymenobacter persicinus]